MDVQGAHRVRPWIEKAGATYAALVDESGELGRRFDFNFVPLTILIDESGRPVRDPKGTSVDKEVDRAEIARWIEEGTLEKISTPGEQGFFTPEARLRYQAAALILSRGNSEKALELLRKALRFDPRNWLIRKQIWAIGNPDRFYRGEVDYEWQKQQLQKEVPLTP